MTGDEFVLNVLQDDTLREGFVNYSLKEMDNLIKRLDNMLKGDKLEEAARREKALYEQGKVALVALIKKYEEDT